LATDIAEMSDRGRGMDAYEISKYKRGKLIHIRLSPRTHQRLKVKAAALGMTMQRWVSRTIRKALRPRIVKAIGLGGSEKVGNRPTGGLIT
jgi:predicted DNA binding CopG/RHH family protein